MSGTQHSPHISLKAESILHLPGFDVTNSLLLSVIVLVCLGIAAFVLRRKLTLVPAMAQNAAEMFLEGTLGLMDSVLGRRALSEKYLPVVATIFLFVLCSNWIGLLPGVGSFTIATPHSPTTPLLRAPSADLNFTLGLAVLAVTITHIFGIAAIGIKSHAHKFFNFSNPINFFVGILELVAEFAKMISFSFRLFGNIFAGEVLLIIVAFLAPYVVPLPFLFLEVFVGLVQALIFAMLTLVFLAGSITTHPEH